MPTETFLVSDQMIDRLQVTRYFLVDGMGGGEVRRDSYFIEGEDRFGTTKVKEAFVRVSLKPHQTH